MANLRKKSVELMREFIDDCLYNKSYGYFSKNVNIFKSSAPIAFDQLRDQDQYVRLLKELYDHSSMEDKSKQESITKALNNTSNTNNTNGFSQLWHTPSELFKPFYGRAIVNFLLNHCERNERLIIYEIGPGNGTLAENILNCLQVEFPQIYKGCEYVLIERSAILSERQGKLLSKHSDRIRFSNANLLNQPSELHDERPCWILAMEVLDNLAHDLIKFRNDDGVLLEAVVHTDPDATYGSIPGKYSREFRLAQDELIMEYVSLGDSLGWKWPSLRGTPFRRALERYGPFDYINPWSCEFIPTDSFRLLKNLSTAFPHHRALFSDFDELPDTIAGHNGPVVQTRYKGVTVACSSVLLERGLFDIFFPTDFSKLSQIHQHFKHKNNPEKRRNFVSKLEKHSKFLKKWLNPADLKRTSTKSGYNPLLQDFENVSFYYG